MQFVLLKFKKLSNKKCLLIWIKRAFGIFVKICSNFWYQKLNWFYFCVLINIKISFLFFWSRFNKTLYWYTFGNNQILKIIRNILTVYNYYNSWNKNNLLFSSQILSKLALCKFWKRRAEKNTLAKTGIIPLHRVIQTPLLLQNW